MTTPRAQGYAVPPPSGRHGRYWMGWPSGDAIPPDHLDAAREAMAGLAALLAEHRPVSVLANPSEVADVSLMCGPGVGAMMVPHGDCCLRVHGPSFLLRQAEPRLAAVRWRECGEGAVADAILDKLRVPVFTGPLPAVPAMVETDGEGIALVSEALPRLAGMAPDAVERALHDWLGIDTVVWLAAGLEGDVSGGRVLNCARFLRPGLVIALTEERDDDPNAALLAENLARLKRVRDARGRGLEVVAVPQPKRRDGGGRRILMSYANCFVDGTLVILPAFEDPRDDVAYDRVVAALMDHTVVSYPAREFAFGGGGLGDLILAEPVPPEPP